GCKPGALPAELIPQTLSLRCFLTGGMKEGNLEGVAFSSRSRHYAIRAPLKLVGLSRFELLTPRLSSVCSNQLSYRPYSNPTFQRTARRPSPSGSLKTR